MATRRREEKMSEMTDEDNGTAISADLDQRLDLSPECLFLVHSDRPATVRLSWHFTKCTLLDWIGLFAAEETDPLGFMDYRAFGVCGPSRGAVEWRIRADQLMAEQDRRNNNNKSGEKDGGNADCGHSPTGADKAKRLQFRYFDGLSGAMRAASPPLLVYSDAQLAITALICKGLSPSANSKPLFYAKISCSAFSSCQYRTQPSADGQWTALNCLFPVDKSAELRVRVKERGWPSGKLVGQANLPLLDLLEGSTAENSRHFSFLLLPHFQQVLLKCQLMPPVRQSVAETMSTLAAAGVADSNGNPLACPALPLSLSSTSSSSASSSFATAQMGQFSSSSFSSAFSNSSSTSASNLPPGWEVRMDARGRLIYLDHVRQKTTWNAPLVLERPEQSALSAGGKTTMANCSTLSARRTVVLPPYGEGAESGEDHLLLDQLNGNNGKSPQMRSSNPPALKFLLRDDLFSNLLGANEQAMKLYNGSPFLKHIVHRIRREPCKFWWSFERNRELVNFVNSFADQTQPLPVGWQMARQSGQPFTRPAWPCDNLANSDNCAVTNERLIGQPLFLDHANRRITPFDPRLPAEVPKWTGPNGGGWQSAPPVRKKRNNNNSNNNGPPDRNQQRKPTTASTRQGQRRREGGIWSWELADKADQIQALVAEHSPELAERIKTKLRLIGRMGELALMRYANDPDLIRAIGLLEQIEQLNENGQKEEIVGGQPIGKSEQRLAQFHTALDRAGYGRGPAKIKFRLRRDHLMEDAYQKILAANVGQLRKCQIAVSFDEEDGLDYGGPSRELFFLLSRELFHPRHGLFEYSSADSHRVQISPMSKFVDHHLRWMELCGRLLGLALVHRCLLDCFFTCPFYKMLAQIPLQLDDLREMDSQLHHSLRWLQQNSISAPDSADLDLNFVVTEELAGKVTEKELLPGGRNLAVTEANKGDFVRLMLRWRVERGVREQSRALLRGLYDVVDRELLRSLDADELELALSGTVQIDIGDWQRNTEYRGGYHADHVLIRWFWQSVLEMRNADRLQLLQFVTGSSSVPFEGFKGLRGSNGPKRFCIERWGNEDSLPRAHTCFNRLDLPSYANRQTLVSKLMMAITESSCYAIE